MSTGQAVAIDALTTSDSTSTANPDGTITTTTTAEPTRMKNTDGTWENLDATLKQNADGSITTTVTPNTLTLSSGGNGPVVSVADGSGHSMALSLPVTVPAPTLSGASATYANIYPGVDLMVTATDFGGFSEVFTVHDAAAQAAAKALTFTLSTQNLNVSQDAAGNLRAVDSASGQTVAVAPAPSMWDSATGATAEANTPENGTVTTPYSSPAGPGTGAHAGKLPITLAPGSLTVAGDPAALGVSEPTYPLYLDPSWTLPYQSGGTLNYAMIQGPTNGPCSGYTTYDSVTQPGVGYNDFDSCVGPYRSYFEIDTSNVLDPSYVIKSATLKINEVYSSWNSCNQGTENISIYSTGPIAKGVTWNNGPLPGAFIDSEPLKSDGNGTTTCPGGTVPGNFNVAGGIAEARANGWTNWTFIMVGNETAGSHSLERFNNNPSITTVYDIPPNAPDNLTTWPTPVTGVTSAGKLGTNPCPPSSTPGYLGIGNIGGSDIATLSARLTSPIAAAQMNGTFTLHNETTNATAGAYTSSGYATTGAEVSVQTSSLTNGDEYSWSATASDQYYPSKPSTACYFKVDTTPPSNPGFTNPSWPPLASGQPSTVDVGTAGSFTVSASDAVSGIAGYYYSIDAYPVPSAGGTYTTNSTISYTPTVWGAHTLYAQALDNAGNVSAVSSYSFYVPWNPANVGVPGSVSGGKSPDQITNPSTGSLSGDLVMVPGDSNPDTTPTVISTPAYSPDGTSPWEDYQITHDGSYTNHQGFDDLWAYQTSAHNLYLYLNTQTATPFERSTRPNPISKTLVDYDAFNNPAAATSSNACVTTSPGSCSSYNDSNWNGLSQILAPGNLYAGDPNTPLGSGEVIAPGLLTVENGTLWYYQGQQGANYLNIVEQLGTTGWDSTTLIGTTTTGSGSTTKTYLLARINTGTMTGAIMQYPITFDTAGNLVNLGTPTGTNGTALTLPDSANQTQATNNDLPAAAYPQLYAWDMHNTGHADLIATTPSGTMIDWPGLAPNGTGLAQFASPESLAAAVSTNAITLGSVGTDYPSGTTWDNGTATLEFNQGQLTVTLDSTGQVAAQYGTNSPNAYLTLQTDGNLVIYPNTGSASLWSLHKLGVGVSSGDSLQLSGGALTLVSSTGSTLWTAESSVPVSQGTVGETAFTTADGNLAIAIGGGAIYTTYPIATGTSPSIADLGGNSYEAAFQGTNGHLETVSNTGAVNDTGYPMAANTSPSIASLPSNSWIIVFQGSNTDVETLTNANSYTDYKLGMAANSSPAIASNPTGGWEFAFQSNTGSMWTHNANGTTTNLSLGMAAGTNPSIVCLTTSGVEIAFQANTGSLWLWGDGSGGGDQQLGMLAGTSPAITALANGEWQAAFQANNGILWTHGNVPGTTSTGLTMATATSPSITATGGETFALAWQSPGNTLTTMAYGGAPANTNHTMTAGTSPNLTP